MFCNTGVAAMRFMEGQIRQVGHGGQCTAPWQEDSNGRLAVMSNERKPGAVESVLLKPGGTGALKRGVWVKPYFFRLAAEFSSR